MNVNSPYLSLSRQTSSQVIRSCLFLGLNVGLSFALAGPATAQSNYAAFELNRESNWDSLATEDMNGDGLKDLVFSHFDQSRGREIHIHHQNSDGGFAADPQRIEVKTEIIAIGFADLRTDPGTELLLFASAGVFSLSSMTEGYAGNLKPLLEWELIATVPSLEQVSFLETNMDINGDGYIDLLIPGRNSYGVFIGGPDESFTLLSQFDTTNDQVDSNAVRGQRGLDATIGINADEGIKLEFTVDSNPPYQGFIEQWGESEDDNDTLLRTENWLPNALLSSLNGDELLDIVYLNVGADGLGQINIHYQFSDTGFNAEPDWIGSIDTKGEIQIVDVNGDGLSDIIRLSSVGNDWDARFYVNAAGEFDFQQASQIMRFSGYDVRIDVVELNQDSLPILSVNYYTIPVVDAIRNASLNRIQLLFDRDNTDANLLFNRRPDTRMEETFSAANVRGLSEQLSLSFDVNGDGANDGLYITENGTIAAKKLDSTLAIADEPFWEYIAPRSVFEFEVLNLNEDQRPDLILRHGNTSTILVAQP